MTKISNSNPVPTHLLSEIKEALSSVKFGSIEIFVQNRVVTQITVRNIHKTSMEIEKSAEEVNIKTNSNREQLTNNSLRNTAYMKKSSVKVS